MQMQTKTQIVPLKIGDNNSLKVEATILGGDQDVASNFLEFESVTDTIEDISNAVVGTFDTIKPNKANVEFGLEIAVESGKLTSILVKGTGKANLKITLEWSKV